MVHPQQRTFGIDTTSSMLSAKNKNKNKKRMGSPRGAGRRGKIKRDDFQTDKDDKASSSTTTTTILPDPSKLRKRMIQLDRIGTGQVPTVVCTVEVDDVEWWEHPDNHNPYGDRLWPSALAISEFLITQGNLNAFDVLELGCGAGLVSIVAAECGAQVLASDISPNIIKLCNIGWLETQKQRKRQKPHNNEVTEPEDQSIIIKPGTLHTSIFDLFSKKPLPLFNSSTNQKVLIATTMMYEPSLAKGLAHRAYEACVCKAWVIIGDDDTGERDGGRHIFLAEFDRLNKENDTDFHSIWTNSVVKSKQLQWSEKHVKILHLNAPVDVLLSDASVTM